MVVTEYTLNVCICYASGLAFRNAPVRTHTHRDPNAWYSTVQLHGRAVGQTSDDLKLANWTHET